jgi:phage/plasmid-like protein (TIGR03299 family)
MRNGSGLSLQGYIDRELRRAFETATDQQLLYGVSPIAVEHWEEPSTPFIDEAAYRQARDFHRAEIEALFTDNEEAPMPAGMTATDTMMSSHGIIPWHRLGNVVDEAVRVGDALELAGLDWEVELQPVFVGRPREILDVVNGLTRSYADGRGRFDSGRFVIDPRSPRGDALTNYEVVDRASAVEGRYAVVRTDIGEALSIVSSYYQPVQNVEGLQFLDALLDSGDLLIETAGSLKGGRIVWICARTPDDLVIGSETYVPYVVFANGHDGHTAVTVTAGPVRVVCANTLALSFARAKARWSMRHTTGVQGRIAEAREALGVVTTYNAEFARRVEWLMRRTQPLHVPERYFAPVFGTRSAQTTPLLLRRWEERYDRINALYRNDAACGSSWGLVNAVNSWELFERSATLGVAKRMERNAMSVLRNRQPYTQRMLEVVRR